MMKQQDNKNNQPATLMSVLKQLLDHVNLSANALAKNLNFPAPTISRLLTGEVTDPRASTLSTIADYFGIKVDQLLGREALNEKFVNQEETSSLITRPPMSIPILSLTEAVEYQKHYKTAPNWFRWQKQLNDNTSDNQNDNIFVATIKNNLYEPIFKNGTFIVINPNVKLVKSGDYVLVSFLGDPTAAIKKYIAEGQYKYLHPLNPDLKTLMLDDQSCSIIGVIIEAYINFKN